MIGVSRSRLLKPPSESFFLFGPRGTGKSTWLRTVFPKAAYIDLLDSALYLELLRAPHRLEALVGKKPAGSWVVIDEIQKTPMLLDEVHRLMESRRWRFALCGSSARKLRRGGVNLLGGRALTRSMEGFVFSELGETWDTGMALASGTLPLALRKRASTADYLHAYVDTYLREEIREEGVVRRLEPFARFLQVAGMMNGQQVNFGNIAREAGVPRSTVNVYFTILQDTLLGHFLPAYQPRLKVRERSHPKFHWFDPGVARAAAGLLSEPPDRLWKGCALETLIFHELRVRNELTGKHRSISFYRTPAGVEIDFVIELKKMTPRSPARVVCIEVKLAEKWDRTWERAIRSLKEDKRIVVSKMLGVYTGTRTYDFDDFHVWPVDVFLRNLANGEVM